MKTLWQFLVGRQFVLTMKNMCTGHGATNTLTCLVFMILNIFYWVYILFELNDGYSDGGMADSFTVASTFLEYSIGTSLLAVILVPLTTGLLSSLVGVCIYE